MQLVTDLEQAEADLRFEKTGVQLMENLTTGFYQIKPLKIEERPLLDFPEAVQLAILAASTFVFGTLVQCRLFRLFGRRRSEGSITSIDRVFLSNTVINNCFYPILLVYLTSNLFIFPMSDYIGTFGCIVMPHFIDVFIRIYSFWFPLMVAIVRYTIVVHWESAQRFGILNLINKFIAISILVPVLMTLSMQYPLGEFNHGPFHFCRGRFEVYFDPMHPDPITPGRREGQGPCMLAYNMAMDKGIGFMERAWYSSLFLACRISTIIFVITSSSIAEMLLYPLTFRHIVQHTNSIADIIHPDIFRQRKQRNVLNIYMTFCTWVLQFLLSILSFLFILFVYGKHKFYHHLFSILNVGVNFALLPCILIILGDENLKRAIANGRFREALSLFLFE